MIFLVLCIYIFIKIFIFNGFVCVDFVDMRDECRIMEVEQDYEGNDTSWQSEY